ncbi:hypothetical protein L6452_18482 [Arctium lappa]|uniref:Uncharacterized protein n=1 Tax=Arctium lappa TaxID=4217 RepID=A0ACB9C653_ARCLA|nr:hypothetical protein L6452_18482 [Arctium lappa]
MELASASDVIYSTNADMALLKWKFEKSVADVAISIQQTQDMEVKERHRNGILDKTSTSTCLVLRRTLGCHCRVVEATSLRSEGFIVFLISIV